jgi:hypothetical protein
MNLCKQWSGSECLLSLFVYYDLIGYNPLLTLKLSPYFSSYWNMFLWIHEMTSWQKCKLMKWPVDIMASCWSNKLKQQYDETVSWWNCKLTKWQVAETACCWNNKLLKQQVAETTSCWNSKLIKQQVNETASWWNCKLMKWQVDEVAS